MAFERIPDGYSPSYIIDSCFEPKSRYIPALKLIVIKKAGELAIITGKDGVSLRLPEGTIHRPRIGTPKSPFEKVIDTALVRTNATLGPGARVLIERVTLVPYVDRFIVQVDNDDEKRRWPNANGKAYMPVIVPVEISGEDPLQKYEITWAKPEQALGMLQENYNDYGAGTTGSSQDALRVSMPSIAETFSDPAWQ